MLSLHAIVVNLRSRIFIKSFSSGSAEDDDPNQHGNFKMAPFWKEFCWTPNWPENKAAEDCEDEAPVAVTVEVPAEAPEPNPEVTSTPALAIR